MLFLQYPKLTNALILKRKLVTGDDNTYDKHKNYTHGTETYKSKKESKNYIPLFKLDTPKD